MIAAWHKDATTTEERAENIYRAGKAAARAESRAPTVELSAEDIAAIERISNDWHDATLTNNTLDLCAIIARHFLGVGYERGVEASAVACKVVPVAVISNFARESDWASAIHNAAALMQKQCVAAIRALLQPSET